MPGGSTHRLQSGQVVTVPSLNPTRQGLLKMDQWLLDTLREEASRRGDAWTPILYQSEVAGKLPQATKDSLNDYIFDGSHRMEP